jgi:xanthine dehydrogenase accessory factor
MIDVLSEVQAWLKAGESVAVATVVRVAGSAPRPVGARLVASSGGRMAGSVSGGCVETTVFAELMDVLDGGPPRLLEFGITEDMIWDVGLACGGTIHVYCQALDPALAGAMADLAAAGTPAVLVTLLEDGPATPAGATALVTAAGIVAGEVPGAAVDAARARLDAYIPGGEVLRLAAGDDAALQVYVESFLAPPRLLIVGGVHVAIPLTRFAKELGFSVIVTDPREKFANRERFPEADEVWVAWPDEALARLDVDERTYVVLLTHDPKIDEPTLAAALDTNAAYVGAIGSRSTHAERFARMEKWGVTREQLGRVYAPIGLDLGGRTPAETALSIIAEVVAVKNGRSGGSLRAAEGPIGQG